MGLGVAERGAGRTGVGQQTVAFVSGHVVDAGAQVEAGVGRTLVDVSLAVRSYVSQIRRSTHT